MRKGKKFFTKNSQFIDSALINDQTYFDYLERFKRVATSMFLWENLPNSMDSRYLEETLYYRGMASILKDENFGIINTQCTTNGYINIYGLPSQLACYSHNFYTDRLLYSGLPVDLHDGNFENQLENTKNNSCILVMNNFERIPTSATMELFAYRLYEAEQTAMTNIKAQKTPILITVDENQRLMMENLYSQYDGNKPVIFGDKKQVGPDVIKSISTQAPFIADKVMEYKKEIWNEALVFLGINTLQVEKKERMITDEASSNNELINLNLMSMLAPRQEACRQFNELFGLTGTDKEIKVRLRSDLYNIVKNMESVVTDYNNNGIPDEEEEV